MSYDPDQHSFKGKMPPRVWDRERLGVFTEPGQFSLEIRSMAVALTQEEVLAYYNLEIGDLPPYDRFFFEMEFTRGRTLAKQNAGAALMKAMDGDKDAVLAYLNRFGGGEWTTKPVVDPGKTVPLHVVIAE